MTNPIYPEWKDVPQSYDHGIGYDSWKEAKLLIKHIIKSGYAKYLKIIPLPYQRKLIEFAFDSQGNLIRTHDEIAKFAKRSSTWVKYAIWKGLRQTVIRADEIKEFNRLNNLK